MSSFLFFLCLSFLLLHGSWSSGARALTGGVVGARAWHTGVRRAIRARLVRC
ncbi:hypothetical protein PAHAL_9G075800 [Panicum hallii]|uniref:Uncharacterized protein n=1 Tax=Panicum hallii TaxID=206008 RepID=A0A2T8I0I5_9POAL|nr:hypothetical protein PAHAL_9G075800 [Panicum hallii]